MSKAGWAFSGIGVVALLLVLIYGVAYWTIYNTLVTRHEGANEGKSKVAAAVNACTQKMAGVWRLADQEGLLEKETYTGVAKARSGLDTAKEGFEKAKDDKKSSIFDLTKFAAQYGEALVQVRVSFEAYPQLRTSETYQKAMTAVQEGFNEIKTALDDWIILIKAYNINRRSLLTNWFASNWQQFPKQIEYYDGGIKEPEHLKVNVDELDPRAKEKK